VGRVERVRNCYKIAVGMPVGTRPLGRLGRRWEDIVEIDLKETGWE